MHLGDEEIQRLLHGEVDGAERSQSFAHLEGCSSCREGFDAAGRDEAEILALLSRVDHPVPRIEPRSFVTGRSTATAGGWKRRAAVIILALGGAGVAYAAPGSPLPAWIRSIGTALARHATAPPAPSTPSLPSPAAPTPTGGIAVVPRERFTIRFTSAQERGTATVMLTDGRDIIVRAVNGAATFMTDVDRLTISNDGSAANYEIQVPRSVGLVDIRVGTRRLLLKRGKAVLSDVAADSLGRYMLPMAGTER